MISKALSVSILFCTGTLLHALNPPSSFPPQQEVILSPQQERVLSRSSEYRFIVVFPSGYEHSHTKLVAQEIEIPEHTSEVTFTPASSDLFLITAHRRFFDCLFPAHIYTDCTPEERRKESITRVANVLTINHILDLPFTKTDIENILVSHALQSRSSEAITPGDFYLSVEILSQ